MCGKRGEKTKKNWVRVVGTMVFTQKKKKKKKNKKQKKKKKKKKKKQKFGQKTRGRKYGILSGTNQKRDRPNLGQHRDSDEKGCRKGVETDG